MLSSFSNTVFNIYLDIPGTWKVVESSAISSLRVLSVACSAVTLFVICAAVELSSVIVLSAFASKLELSTKCMKIMYKNITYSLTFPNNS